MDHLKQSKNNKNNRKPTQISRGKKYVRTKKVIQGEDRRLNESKDTHMALRKSKPDRNGEDLVCFHMMVCGLDLKFIGCTCINTKATHQTTKRKRWWKTYSRVSRWPAMTLQLAITRRPSSDSRCLCLAEAGGRYRS